MVQDPKRDPLLPDDGGQFDAGKAHDPPRPGADEVLTLEQAAYRYKFSPRQLRRRLDLGGFPGAYRVTTGSDPDWRIPTRSFEALGYVPYRPLDSAVEDIEAEDQGAVAGAERVELDAVGAQLDADIQNLKAVRDQLNAAVRRLQADRQGLALCFAQLAVNLHTMRGDRREMEAERQRLDRHAQRVEEARGQQQADRRNLDTKAQRLEARARRLEADRQHLETQRRQLEAEWSVSTLSASKPSGPRWPGLSISRDARQRSPSVTGHEGPAPPIVGGGPPTARRRTARAGREPHDRL